MATPKYKKQYQEMIEYNSELFEKLKNTNKKLDEFAETQRKVLRIVHQYESALCSRTETTKYSMYSLGLSDKFMELVRESYPEIDTIVS